MEAGGHGGTEEEKEMTEYPRSEKWHVRRPGRKRGCGARGTKILWLLIRL